MAGPKRRRAGMKTNQAQDISFPGGGGQNDVIKLCAKNINLLLILIFLFELNSLQVQSVQTPRSAPTKNVFDSLL